MRPQHFKPLGVGQACQAEPGDDEASAGLERPAGAQSASRRLGLAASAVCLAGAGAVLLVAQVKGRPATLRTEAGALVLAEDGAEGEGCYTAHEGDDCFENVRWHMRDLKNHPKWYGDLNLASTFEDFQAWVHSGSPTTCPRPCGKGAAPQQHKEPAAAARAAGTTEQPEELPAEPLEDDDEAGEEDEQDEPARDAAAEAGAAAAEENEEDEDEVDDARCSKDAALLEKLDASGECHQPVEGEICYASVAWGLLEGIAKHPTWYEGTGVSKESTFEDLQKFLYEKHPKSSCCPKACDECRTAVKGELCHDSVIWASTEGIVKHPDWYEGTGLSKSSPLEDWQAYLQGTHPKSSGCEKLPCIRRPTEVPSA